MNKIKLLAGTLGLALAMPLAAAAGRMDAGEVGMQPMTGLSAADYVAKAADGDMFEIESSKLALAQSKNTAVRTHAQKMVRDHTRTSDDLKKAVARSRMPGLTPPAGLTPEKQAKVDALRAASPADFDALYLDGQKTAHQEAWAVHKGYADSGDVPALKAAATKTLGVVETHLRAMPKGMTGM